MRTCSPFACALALVLACGDSGSATDGSTGSTTGTTAGTTGGESSTTAPTTTAPTTTGGEGFETVLECMVADPCGTLEPYSGDPNMTPPDQYGPEELCAFEQLIAGGTLTLQHNYGCEGMSYGRILLVRSDRSVVVQYYAQVFEGGVDLHGIEAELEPLSGGELCTLQPVSYFQLCQEAFDAGCTQPSHWLVGCAKPAPGQCTP